jgi:hypothetical protein
MLHRIAFWNATGAAHHEARWRGSPIPAANEQKKHQPAAKATTLSRYTR